MKKVVSLFLIFAIFFTLPFTCSASAIGVDFGIDYVSNFAIGIYSSYRDSSQKKIEAARSYYFYMISNDVLHSGLTIFDSSGSKFSNEILDYYFEQYVLAVDGSTDVYFSDGNIFLRAAGFNDVRFSLRLLSFSKGFFETSVSGSTNKQDFKNYYNTYLARYLLKQGQAVTDPNPGKNGLDIAPGYVTSEDFKTSLSEDSSKYFVKNPAGKISYRNDNAYQIGLWNSTYSPTFFFNGEFNSVASSDGFYAVPFFTDGTTQYIGEYQFHFYFDIVENWYLDRDEIESVNKYLCVDVWNLVEGSEDEPVATIKSQADFYGYNYFYLKPVYIPNVWIDFYGFKLLTDCYKNTNSKQLRLGRLGPYVTLFSPDFSQTLDFYDVWESSTYAFKGSYDNHDKNCSLENDDVGFITSSSPLSSTFNFDINKISDGQIVTVTGGDTIYNYTITNPNSGESNTINEYVTNNYTYVTNNNGGGGSGSGGVVGGNVSVGGNINVGGSVDVDVHADPIQVDINVNGSVNGAGGSGGTNVNPDDFTDTSSVDLDKYYNYAVEESTGFQKFLSDFFSFLPSELLALILFAVSIAIVCRVFGR